MHDVVKNMMVEFGEKARITQDFTAMSIFRLGFTTTLCADGVAFFSNSHTNLAGGTVDNLLTAALSESSLNTAITMLMEQKDQADVVRGHQPYCLLVPPALFKSACEITESELQADTANNNINVYSTKYGIYVKQSPYLGAANTGGSDTAWFLLAKNHQVHRWVRQSLTTNLIPWELQRNNNYIYKGEYREVYGAVTYEGAVGSTGAG